MKPIEAVKEVQSRKRREVLSNASLYFLLFISLGLFGLTLVYLDLISAGEGLSYLCALLAFFFWFFPRLEFSLFNSSKAAWELDEKLQSSSRFTTLASASELPQANLKTGELELVSKQAQTKLRNVSLAELFPFILNPVSRPSLYVSPVAVILSLMLLLFYEPPVNPPERTNLPAKEAKQFEEELKELPQLPPPLEKGIEELSQKLLDKEVSESELLEDLEQLIDLAEDIEDSEFELDPKEIEQNEKNQEQAEPQKQNENKQPPPEKKKEEEKQEKKESNPSDSATALGESESKSEKEKPGESNSQSNNSNSKDNKQPQDSNSKGESKQDSQSSGKDGENKTGESGDNNQEQKKNDNSKGSGKNASESKPSEQGKSGEQSKQQAIEQAKEMLKEMQEQLKGQSPQEQTPENQNQGEKNQEQKNKGQEPEPEPGQEQEQGQEPNQPKAGQEKKDDKQNQEQKQQDAESNSQQQEKPSKNNQSNNSQNKPSAEKTDKEKQQKQPGNQGKQTASPENKQKQKETDKPSQASAEGNTQANKQMIVDEKNSPPKDKAKDMPINPQEMSRTEDPNAEIPGTSAKNTKIEIPQDQQKIVVRELGSAGKKLYKNSKAATPKTALSAADFEKGEAALSEQEQRIPLEYLESIR